MISFPDSALKPSNSWKVSFAHPDITLELHQILNTAFERLAYLNMLDLTGEPISKAQKIEQKILRKLHTDFRMGKGPFKAYTK